MSDAERERKIKDIFASATELVGDAREAYIVAACGGDPALIADVRSWLTSYAESSGFIETPAFSPNMLFDSAAPMAGRRFGNYEVIREIGSGGMGAVYLARRTDGEFDQQVALKVVRQSIAESRMIERFRSERQILASLNHPNIARLLDGGISDDGVPYLAMEYVEGFSLTEYAEREDLSLSQRLRLFLKVCSAVAYAHRNLVVHRDIKPGNILVTPDGEPKLLDFGLAKLLDESSVDTAATRTAFRALTPAYASPEQLSGGMIATSSDVFSLGVILYELLTGERPFKLEGKSLGEIVRTITDSRPLPPSRVENAKLKLNSDLDNIVLTALRSEPDRRYGLVESLAADIRNYLDGKPVTARRSTLKYRAGKFVRRNKAAMFAAAVIAITIIGGVAFSLYEANIARRQRDQAQLAQARAEQVNRFLRMILSAASPEARGKDATVMQVLDDAHQNVDVEFADQPDLKAQALLTIGRTYIDLGNNDKADKSLTEALAINHELYGDGGLSTAVVKGYLAEVRLDQSKIAEAESLAAGAIDVERALAPRSTDLAFSLDVIGELYVRTNQFPKGSGPLQESIEIYDSLNGPNNLDSAFVRISLARSNLFQGKTADAETRLRRSIEVLQSAGPRSELRLAIAMLNLGLVLMSTKRFDEAVATIDRTESILMQKQGESFAVFEARAYRIAALYAKGDLARVTAIGGDAIALGRRVKAESSADFQQTLQRIGMSYTSDGRAKDGEPLLRESVEIAGKIAPISATVAKACLGINLTEQRQLAKSEPMIAASLSELNSDAAANAATVAQLKEKIAKAYQRIGRPVPEQFR